MLRNQLAVAFMFAVTSSSCMPFVQHGPWVREGASGGFLVSGLHTRGPRGDYPGTAFGIDGGIRAGYVPADSSSPAFAAGVQLSLWALLLVGTLDDASDAWRLAAGDVYMTGPRSTKLATSVGATASFYHVMPYIQLGSRNPQQNAWYTTQALLFLRDPLDNSSLGDGFIWLPSLTYVDRDDRPRAAHITVGGGVGIDTRGDPFYIFTIAGGMEFFRKNARVR
jgi:hypothetical protein